MFLKKILLTFAISSLFYSCINYGCSGYLEVLETESFDGVVTELRVTEQRRYQEVYVNGSNSPVFTVFGSMDQEIWQTLKVGDHIKKESGSLLLILKDQQGNRQELYFKCK